MVHACATSIACRDRIDDDLPCAIRANFGPVLIASMFGVRVEQIDDNPPWVRHFETLAEFIDAIYAQAAKTKIPIVRISVKREELTSGSVMRRFPTGVLLLH